MNMKTILASAALAMTAATGALAEKTKVGFVSTRHLALILTTLTSKREIRGMWETSPYVC